MPVLLHIERLSIDVASPTSGRRLVSEVSLSLPAGQALALVGETGCGKSLVAQAVLGLLPIEMSVAGRILYRGHELTGMSPAALKRLWGRDIFLFPQEPTLALNPTMRALRQVAEVFRWIRGRGGKESATETVSVMDSVGLDARSDGRKYPCQLSGGMRQRLAAAITLAEPADLVMADEPTKGLDPDRRDRVVDLLRNLTERGRAVMVITHDMEAARRLGGRVAVMYGGRIMEQGPAAQVLDRPRHPYTRALLGALPANGLRPIALRLHDRPLNGGCVFAPRCGRAVEICFEREPEADQSAEGCRCHVGGR